MASPGYSGETLVPNLGHPQMQGLLCWLLAAPSQAGGGRWLDLIGQNHGTPLLWTLSHWAPAQGPGGLGSVYLDGTSGGSIDCGTNLATSQLGSSTSNPFSLCCWVKFIGSSAFSQGLASRCGAVHAGGWYVAFSNNTLIFFVQRSTTNVTSTIAFATPSAWTHVAFTIDGSNTAANIICYLNGRLKAAQSSGDGVGTSSSDAANHLLIGTTASSILNNRPTMWIDDFRLYNRVLTAADVQSIYEGSRRGYANVLISGGSKVLWWDLGFATTLNRTASDKVGVHDTPSRLLSPSRTRSDNLGLHDSASRQMTPLRAPSDNLGLRDNAPSRRVTVKRLPSDVLGLRDVQSRLLSPRRSISDTLGLRDTVARLLNALRTRSDVLGLRDGTARLLSPLRALANNLGLYDSTRRLLNPRRTRADVLGVQDGGAHLLLTNLRRIADNLGLHDNAPAVRMAALLRAVADMLGTYTNAPVRTVAAKRSPLDRLGLRDAVSRKTATKRTLASNLALSDLSWMGFVFFRTASDKVGLHDAVSRLMTWLRFRSDNLGLHDVAPSRKGTAKRLPSDRLGLHDNAPSRNATLLRALANNLGLRDVAPRWTTALRRTLANNLGGRDSLARKGTILRKPVDRVGVAHTVLRSLAVLRLLADRTGIRDVLARKGIVKRKPVDNLGGRDVPKRLTLTLRAIANNLGVQEVPKRKAVLLRTLSATMGLPALAPTRKATYRRTFLDRLGLRQGSVLRSLVLVRTFSATMGLRDAASRKATAKRTAAPDSIGGRDVAPGRKVTARRTFSATLGTPDTAPTRKVTYRRTFLDRLGLRQGSVLRSMVFARLFSASLGLRDSLARKATAKRTVTPNNLGGRDSAPTRRVQALRTFLDRLGIHDNAPTRRTSALVRRLTDRLGLREALFRLATARRSVLDRAGLSQPAILRSAILRRLLTANLGLHDTNRAGKPATFLAGNTFCWRAPDLGRHWVGLAPPADPSMPLPTATLFKHPLDVRLFTFDFAAWPAFDPSGLNQTIASGAIAYTGSDAALTVGNVSVSGTLVQAVLSGGTNGVLYTLATTATTSGGFTLEQNGLLQVQNPVPAVVATQYKRVSESGPFDFDFENFDEFDPSGLNQSITSAAVVHTGRALTIGVPGSSGSRVQAVFSAGTVGATYTCTAIVTTSGGYTLVQDGLLQVLAD